MKTKTPKTNTISISISNCLDCTEHKVQSDPDPDDWFCDDGCKVLCQTAHKYITMGCRPYNLRKECPIPNWCPKKK